MDGETRFLPELWRLSVEAAPYLVLGFFVAAILLYVVPQGWMLRWMGRGRFRSTVAAAAIGIPLPLCSCSVVPTAMAMQKRGATKGATLSFLISTPETGVDSILLTYGLLGPVMAIVRPVAAFLSSILAGFLLEVISPSQVASAESVAPIPTSASVSDCGCHDESSEGQHAVAGGKGKFLLGLWKSFLELFDEIAVWMMIGLIASAALSTWLPPEWLGSDWGRGWTGMVMAALVGAPMYVCATSSTPLAMVLLAKGLSPGAALVFLLVGPATNLGTMGIVWKMLGKRGLFSYLVCIIGVAFLFGWFLDRWMVLPTTSGDAPTLHEEGHLGGEIVWGIAAGLLWSLMIGRSLKAFFGRFRHEKGEVGDFPKEDING